MKVDVLLVVAHPDDDVMLGGYLARLVFDEHKRVAVVYTTDGDGGGNATATESGQALGMVRQIEARRALHVLGIDMVWFLSGHDTPGQDPLRSLDRWNHGQFLDDLVRIVRIVRPGIILTWLPASVSGENHGDHQASGVLAVEAFDIAGDPLAFPEQVSPPRDLHGMSNLTEGLLPWQPQKLYFITDAFEVFSPYWHNPATRSPFRTNLGDGTGPVYNVTGISPSQNVSYAELMAHQQAEYATQEGNLASPAIHSHDFSLFAYPEHFIFGKSLVGGSVTGDIFEGISDKSIPYRRVQISSPPDPSGITLEIGDPWHFYAAFWHAHQLDHLAKFIPIPELGAGSGERLHIPLLACNHTAQSADIAITSTLPAGFVDAAPTTSISIAPNTCNALFAEIETPRSGHAGWQQLSWQAAQGPQSDGSASIRIYVDQSGGLPQ